MIKIRILAGLKISVSFNLGNLHPLVLLPYLISLCCQRSIIYFFQDCYVYYEDFLLIAWIQFSASARAYDSRLQYSLSPFAGEIWTQIWIGQWEQCYFSLKTMTFLWFFFTYFPGVEDFFFFFLHIMIKYCDRWQFFSLNCTKSKTLIPKG